MQNSSATVTKRFKFWPGTKIPDIQIWLRSHMGCLNYSDQLRPSCGSNSLEHLRMNMYCLAQCTRVSFELIRLVRYIRSYCHYCRTRQPLEAPSLYTVYQSWVSNCCWHNCCEGFCLILNMVWMLLWVKQHPQEYQNLTIPCNRNQVNHFNC